MLPGVRGQATITLMTDDRPLHSWNRKTSLLRDRSNSARGQRHRQERHPHFAAGQSLSDCTATIECEDAWSMRTVPDLHQGRTRSDLLFTMSNNTRTPGEPGRTRIFSIPDERRDRLSSGDLFASTHPKHPLGGVAPAATPCAGAASGHSLSRNGCQRKL